MSAVSTTEAWPARGRPFTVSDLDRLPAVEIRSPSTAFELREGQYATLGTAKGRETLATERPFRVEVVPAALLAGLPGRRR